MAKLINTADLDKVVKLVETAMKTEAKNAKLREQQRVKAEAALEAFKDNFAARHKEGIARQKDYVTDLAKAVGIAAHLLTKGHPLTAKLNVLIDELKKINFEPRFDELNKAINAIESWDVTSDKTDPPKLAIKLIGNTKTAIDSGIAERKKALGAWRTLADAAKKDLDAVDDPDVKKDLTKILEGELF